MIQLPPGFDVSLLVNDVVTLVLPFVYVVLLIGAFTLVTRILKRG